MRLGRRSIFLFVIFTALIALSLLAFAGDKKDKRKSAKAGAAVPMDEDRRALHALNRLGFGPRPGEVQRVEAMGVDKWIEQQLHPEKIDDSAMEGRLAAYRTLKMDTRELVLNFPPPQVLKAAADGRLPLPSDPEERAIYESGMQRVQLQQQIKPQAQNLNASANANNTAALNNGKMVSDMNGKMMADMRLSPDGKAPNTNSSDAKAMALLAMPPEQRMNEVLSMSPNDRDTMLKSLKPKDREGIMVGLTPKDHETLLALVNPQAVIQGELTQAKLLRAIYSERQLQEVMTDFWVNHFNIFIGKGADNYLLTSYERDVIRPRALGKFKDLLLATAKSPAMLFYLDNWQSVGPNSDAAMNRPPRQKKKAGPRPRARIGLGGGPFGWPRPRVYVGGNMGRPKPPNQPKKGRPVSGLNENYAREVMELHTLGVDGGYTQKDVTELAKILTGWTFDRKSLIKEDKAASYEGGFSFNERTHEPGKKVFLGKKYDDRGVKEGEKALDVLAHSPATARFISRKLAMRFVSDNPPDSLVDRMANTFMHKDGDMREVLRTLFRSPEFWAADAYRAKVKTPFEFVASAVRATAAEVSNPQALNGTLQRLGMPLYGMQPPTGYSMKESVWMNSGALIDRWNFALALGSGRLNGIQWDPHTALQGETIPGDSSGAVAVLEAALLGNDVSKTTHETLLKQAEDPHLAAHNNVTKTTGPDVPLIAGLIMGSPEFQHR